MSSQVRFVEQEFNIEYWGPVLNPLGSIANAARTCYRSGDREKWKEQPGSKVHDDLELVERLIERGHEAMLEHSYLSVRFRCDRAVANEIVRHRHFSFAQESTRYVNYGKKGFEFILPLNITGAEDTVIRIACHNAARAYDTLIDQGATPQVARAVLPLCTATEIVVSGNFREWRHFLKLRTALDAHPQMRALVTPLLERLQATIPTIFEDIQPEATNE